MVLKEQLAGLARHEGVWDGNYRHYDSAGKLVDEHKSRVLCCFPEGGDFAYVPAGAIHVIANASETEEASLIFCYIGVPSTDAAETVWLTEDGTRRLPAKEPA